MMLLLTHPRAARVTLPTPSVRAVPVGTGGPAAGSRPPTVRPRGRRDVAELYWGTTDEFRELARANVLVGRPAEAWFEVRRSKVDRNEHRFPA